VARKDDEWTLDGQIDALLSALETPTLARNVLGDLARAMLTQAREDGADDAVLAMHELGVALVALTGMTVHEVAEPYERRFADLEQRMIGFEERSAARYAEAYPALIARLDRIEAACPGLAGADDEQERDS
jgi:hypothetical protein